MKPISSILRKTQPTFLATQHDLVNKGVRLLCDLFHMNIEEVDAAETITRLGSKKQDLIGHIHYRLTQTGEQWVWTH